MAIDLKIDRRGLFYGAFAALIGGSIVLSQRGARAASQWPDASFFTAARIDGIDGGALLCNEGVCSFALPARAHAPVLMRDTDSVLLVGRRPGTFAAALDLKSPDARARMFHPIRDHRFVGHAAVNGEMLVTTEMEAFTGEGAAVLRDARTFAPARALMPASNRTMCCSRAAARCSWSRSAASHGLRT